jgi:hypothetical protein
VNTRATLPLALNAVLLALGGCGGPEAMRPQTPTNATMTTGAPMDTGQASAPATTAVRHRAIEARFARSEGIHRGEE